MTGAPLNCIFRAASVKRPSEYANKLYFGNFSFSRKLIFWEKKQISLKPWNLSIIKISVCGNWVVLKCNYAQLGSHPGIAFSINPTNSYMLWVLSDNTLKRFVHISCERAICSINPIANQLTRHNHMCSHSHDEFVMWSSQFEWPSCRWAIYTC